MPCRASSWQWMQLLQCGLSQHKLLEESHHHTVLCLAVDESAAQRTTGADRSLIPRYTCAVVPPWMLILFFCGIMSSTGASVHLTFLFMFVVVLLYFLLVWLIFDDCGPSGVALGFLVGDFHTHLRGLTPFFPVSSVPTEPMRMLLCSWKSASVDQVSAEKGRKFVFTPCLNIGCDKNWHNKCTILFLKKETTNSVQKTLTVFRVPTFTT